MVGEISPELETLRLLAVSAAGFFLGALCILLPRFRGARVYVGDIHLSFWELTLVVIAIFFLSVHSLIDMFTRFSDPKFAAERSPFYLIAFVCLDIFALIMAKKLHNNHHKPPPS